MSIMQELSWTPTLTWTTGTPASVSTVARAFRVDNLCYFYFSTSSADGNGATKLVATLPTRPIDGNYHQAIEGYEVVDGTYSDVQAYIDCLDNTAANRYIETQSMTAWTDGKTCSMVLCGWYEIDVGDTATWTPTVTYTTSNWDSATTVGRFRNLDGIVHCIFDNRSADAKGVTAGVQFTTPTYVLDLSTYVPFCGMDAVTAGDDSVDYDNNLYLMDCDNATEGSRIVSSNAVGVMANGKAATTWASGIYEQIGWSAWTPTLTWTGTAPTCTTVGRYKVRNGLCYFNAYVYTADGNGCTALTISGLPVDPAYLGCEIALTTLQTVNTTDSDPLGFLAADEQASSDRTVQFKGLSACTDATAAYVYVSGVYPVG